MSASPYDPTSSRCTGCIRPLRRYEAARGLCDICVSRGHAFPAESLLAKVHPRRFPNMSPRMAALVGCILHERFTDPAIEELCVTSDGFLLARHAGGLGFNDFMGDAGDLARNWHALLDCAGLSGEEMALATELYQLALGRLPALGCQTIS